MKQLRVKLITATNCPAGTPSGCLDCPFFCGLTINSIRDGLCVSCGYRPDKK